MIKLVSFNYNIILKEVLFLSLSWHWLFVSSLWTRKVFFTADILASHSMENTDDDGWMPLREVLLICRLVNTVGHSGNEPSLLNIPAVVPLMMYDICLMKNQQQAWPISIAVSPTLIHFDPEKTRPVKLHDNCVTFQYSEVTAITKK